MSMIFLDPNTYCFSEDEWVGGDALNRLDDLLSILLELEDSEERLEASEGAFFLLPNDLLLFSFEVNPNINSPANGHYNRLFQTKILPALMRRQKELEVGETCDQLLSDHVAIADTVAKEALRSFLDSISRTEAGPLVYAYHPQRISLDLGSGCFSDEVSIPDVSGGYFANYHQLFPIEKKKNVACALNESIMILRERLSLTDATWLDHNPTGIFLHDDFVPSISGADFRGFDCEYRERIIYTILQIVVARSVTTKEHSMSPQTVQFQNTKHSKWNAYVFQMGPNATDVRCSRLYFSKIQDGMLLFRYEENAHP